MTITVEELRRKYPNPVSFAFDVADDAYCVGKALCLELGMPHYSWDIVAALQTANPNLTEHEAQRLYGHIIHENDEGNYEDAWAWMEKALSA